MSPAEFGRISKSTNATPVIHGNSTDQKSSSKKDKKIKKYKP
jgi:hypothetical protein